MWLKEILEQMDRLVTEQWFPKLAIIKIFFLASAAPVHSQSWLD